MLRLRFLALLPLAMVWSSAALAAPISTSDDFEADAIGSFPAGWLDIAAVNPLAPNPPLPSAQVIATTDAFGNPTQALAINDAVAESQGIYRHVPISSRYLSKADVRIDRYGGTDANSGTATDWAIEIGVNALDGMTDPAFIPSIGVYASTLTQGWRLYVATANVGADIDLGIAAAVGTWYSVTVDIDVNAATVRSIVADTATSTILSDVTTSLAALGAWDPAVDGLFDIEGFFDGELTNTTLASLAVIDNIDQVNTPIPEGATLGMLTIALAGFGLMLRRRAR